MHARNDKQYRTTRGCSKGLACETPAHYHEDVNSPVRRADGTIRHDGSTATRNPTDSIIGTTLAKGHWLNSLQQNTSPIVMYNPCSLYYCFGFHVSLYFG
jgi:hypothetical protein